MSSKSKRQGGGPGFMDEKKRRTGQFARGDYMSFPLKECYYLLNPQMELSGNGVYLENDHLVYYVTWLNGVVDGDVIALNTQLKGICGHYEVRHGYVKRCRFLSTKQLSIPLYDSKARWEGDATFQRERYGWGLFFDPDGNVCYEGFCIGNVYVGYGRFYHVSSATVEYEGTICNNMRCGYGSLYSEDGSLLYRGTFFNDKPYVSCCYSLPDNTQVLSKLESRTETIVVGDHCANSFKGVMNLSLLPYLKDFAVGNDSFRLCSGFCVRDHGTLHSIIVGSYSFIGAVAKRKSSRNAFVFAIENCPSLRTVHICHHSFFHCSVYLLSSCSRRCV